MKEKLKKILSEHSLIEILKALSEIHAESDDNKSKMGRRVIRFTCSVLDKAIRSLQDGSV